LLKIQDLGCKLNVTDTLIDESNETLSSLSRDEDKLDKSSVTIVPLPIIHLNFFNLFEILEKLFIKFQESESLSMPTSSDIKKLKQKLMS